VSAVLPDSSVYELTALTSEQYLINALRNNVIGPLNLVRGFLPYMRSRGSGTLLFMSSVGAYYGSPCAGSYSGSKGLLEALVPNLSLEIAPFGLRTCLLTPGYFRTSVMTRGNVLYRAPNPLPEYAEMNRLLQAGCDAMDGNQLGDPKKAAEVIVEAVRGEGRCEGKTLPPRLPVGPDAIQAIKNNCTEKLKICEEWEAIVSSTNLDSKA
jgi:NAD(P)-dependent dehydrogenase (short-subunit alcohol dehydrogenase family)